MDAEPPTMVLRTLAALIWPRAQAIPNSPGGWGRLLASVMAGMWALSLWSNGDAGRYSGTGEMVELLGLQFTAFWMLGAAVLPMMGLLIGWLPLRALTAVLSQFTWVYLLFEMLTHGHMRHLSTGSCIVGVLACLRADLALWAQLARRYQ